MTEAFLPLRGSHVQFVATVDGFPAFPPTLLHRLAFAQAPIRRVPHRAPLRKLWALWTALAERYGVAIDPADAPKPSDEIMARSKEKQRQKRAAEREAAA